MAAVTGLSVSILRGALDFKRERVRNFIMDSRGGGKGRMIERVGWLLIL